MTKERIEKILKAGANVILTTKGIDDMALKASFYGSLFSIMPCHYWFVGTELSGMSIDSLSLAIILPEL